MTSPLRVLVTGAEEHQGLSVIRGLGQAGATVIACGSQRHCIGFRSRYASECHTYTNPFEDPARCRHDLLAIIRRTRPDVVMPAVESTLVMLNQIRADIDMAVLAAPPAPVLEYALDKSLTLRLAERLEVPVPRSIEGDSIDRILLQAAEFRFPVAVKPRGPRLHVSTEHRADFKVRYARSLPELRAILEPMQDDARSLLVQEYVPGIGRCVTAVCDRGVPVAMFQYARLRELPHTGGVSVLRRSEALEDRPRDFAAAMLGAVGWHGVAMVEFRYDRRDDRFTLMEVNGRFQASVALSLDAGLNLPWLAACLYAGGPLPPAAPYRVGVTERWLRGDVRALVGALSSPAPRVSAHTIGPGDEPSAIDRWQLIWEFLRDFRPGVRYDEFRLNDWKPGVVETMAILRLLGGYIVSALRVAGRLALQLATLGHASVTARANTPTQDSMRA